MRGPKTKERTVSNPPEAFPQKPGQAPEYLDEVGREEYARLSAILEYSGTLGKTDPRLIEMYSLNYSILRRATLELQTQKLSLGTGDRLFVNPNVGVIHNSTQKLAGIQAELGLTPASITKIEVEVKRKDSPIDQFVKELNAPKKKG